MKKLCARWVLLLLTIDQKRTRKDTSQQCLSILKRNPQDFWRWFMTVDKTWIQHYTPKTEVEAVNSAWWMCPEEGEDCFVGREDNGHCLLGSPRNHLRWLLTEESNSHRSILFYTSESFVRRAANETVEIGAQKGHLLSWQRSTSFTIAMAKLHELRIAAPFTLFFWFDSL